MKLFRKIDTVTGNFLEDVLFESHPILMGEFTVEEIDEETGETIQYAEQKPLTDAEYVEEAPPQGLYLPRYLNGAWVEGGVAPEPVPHDPTVDERLDSLEDVMLFLI